MYQRVPTKHTRRRRYVAAIIFLAVIILVGTALLLMPKKETAVSTIKATPARTATPASISSKVLFVGDINWGRSVRDWSDRSPLKTAYPFSGLSGFHRENYDAWIGNLECPTVPGVKPTQTQERVNLIFNCDPAYLPQLAKWFTAVSMANNHSSNQGSSGFQATRAQLDANHIQYFGHYDPSVIDQQCEVISMPVHIKMSNQSVIKGSLPFALCGYHSLAKIPSDASLAVMQKYAKYMPVIAYPHMGVEYTPQANASQVNLYRKMIDNGADAVIGNHPHWVQNSEAYKGKLIVYSMGNFIFDQQFSPEVMRSAAIIMNMSLGKTADPNQLNSWLKLGPKCAKFADDCLAQAEAQHLSRLPLSLRFGITGVDTSNKLTRPASPELTKAIADRLDWNATAPQLQPAGYLYPPKNPTAQ